MTGTGRSDFPTDHSPIHPDVEISDARTAFQRFVRIDVVRFRHRRFSGEWSVPQTHDVMRRGPAVAIVLYDPDHDRVVLVEQFRLPALLAGAKPWQVEVVAGLIDPGETPEVVAIRETREETGLDVVGDVIPIQRFMPSSGSSDVTVFLFCARVDSTAAAGVHGVVEEGEDIRVLVKTTSEVEALLDAGTIENGHSLVGLYWLLRHRANLRRLWLAAP